MVTDLFGLLLQELGQRLNIKDLHADQNNSCLIRFKDGFEIQLELDHSGQFLLIGANLGDVPRGRYRQDLFKEALKANDMVPPMNGTFAFSEKTQHLILFMKIQASQATGEKIAALIPPFVEKGTLWAEAIKRSEIPPLNPPVASGGSSMFGMRP